MVRYTLLIVLILAAFQIQAQDDPIFTDRPNVTDAVSVIPKGTFQVELGYLNSETTNNGSTFTYATTPNLSLKYGLSDRFELRILTNYATSKNQEFLIGTTKSNGLTPITLSPKFALLEQKGVVPKTSFVANFTFPDVGAKSFQVEEFNYGFRSLFEYGFGKLSWTNSIGYDWFDFDFKALSFTTVGGYAINDKIGSFLELYGSSFSGGGESYNIDFGLTYLISNTIQIDAIYGLNIDNQPNNRILGFGIAWKTNRKDHSAM